jgi:hypothetical protein
MKTLFETYACQQSRYPCAKTRVSLGANARKVPVCCPARRGLYDFCYRLPAPLASRAGREWKPKALAIASTQRLRPGSVFDSTIEVNIDVDNDSKVQSHVQFDVSCLEFAITNAAEKQRCLSNE